MKVHLYSLTNQIPGSSEVNIERAVNEVRDNFSHTEIAASNVEFNFSHSEEAMSNVLFFYTEIFCY